MKTEQLNRPGPGLTSKPGLCITTKAKSIQPVSGEAARLGASPAAHPAPADPFGHAAVTRCAAGSGSAPAALGPVRLRVVPPRAPVPPPPQVCGPLCPPRLRAPPAGRCPAYGTLAASRDRQFRAKALPLSALGGLPRRPATSAVLPCGTGQTPVLPPNVGQALQLMLQLLSCPTDALRALMLRGLRSRPRAPASDEVRQYFVRLRQAKAPPDFIARSRRKTLLTGLSFFFN